MADQHGRHDEGGIVVPVNEAEVAAMLARVKDGWVLTFNQQWRFENGRILVGPLTYKWHPPAGDDGNGE